MNKRIAEMEKEIARITFGSNEIYSPNEFPCYVNCIGKQFAIVDRVFSFKASFYKLMDILKKIKTKSGYQAIRDAFREFLKYECDKDTTKGWTEDDVMEFAKGRWQVDEHIFTAINGNLMFRYIPETPDGPIFVVRHKDRTNWLLVKEIRTNKPEGWNPLNS